MTTVQAGEFHIAPLSTKYQQQLIQQKLWVPSCPVPLARLRNVTVLYRDFSAKTQTGHLIVLDAVATQTVAIFKQLYHLKFPIASIRPTSEFNGNDDLSMQANNSSAFNCREITGGGKPSLHGYGVAIDINPVQNPYLYHEPALGDQWSVLPVNGQPYIDRQPLVPGMVEPIVEIFKQQGFLQWGGHWKSIIDYQHFQTSRLIANLLANMTPDDAAAFFIASSQHPELLQRYTDDDLTKLLEYYHQDPHHFIETLLYYGESEFKNR